MTKNLFGDYIVSLSDSLSNVCTGDRKKNIKTEYAIARIIKILAKIKKSKNSKVFFIGNGGSSAIAGHQAIDYWKNGGIRAMSFNDNALLTCISNDFGYEYVFQKPIERFAEKGDILFAISSSGKSKNIINAVKAARKKGVIIVTLSGFNKNNPLRKLGDINFYVSSCSYGIVEISHLSICHSILDHIIENKL